ncbi:STAS/SEC14 domain-containing protein [bacterium]|nr:STAS/SEC14 domain-containing protein [bacterium]
MEDRIRFFEHSGKKILLLDVSGMKPGESFIRFIDSAKQVIRTKPENSLLTLFDATDSYFNNATIDMLKEFTAGNKSYVRASAVVGITGLKKVMLNFISKFSSRTFKQSDTREEAMDWLVQQ